MWHCINLFVFFFVSGVYGDDVRVEHHTTTTSNGGENVGGVGGVGGGGGRGDVGANCQGHGAKRLQCLQQTRNVSIEIVIIIIYYYYYYYYVLVWTLLSLMEEEKLYLKERHFAHYKIVKLVMRM